MLVNTTARTYYARELVLPSRRIFGRTFFSPPAPQPTSSTPSTTLAPPSHVPQEAGTVRVQSQGIKTNVSVRVGADRPSHICNPDYGGKYGQQEAESYELVKE